jgi:hypothetical protein
MRLSLKRRARQVKATTTASGPLHVQSLPRNIYRRFLYLDSDGVMNSLSSLEGGDIDEVLERILSVKEGHAGLALDVWAANISAGGKLDKGSELLNRTVEPAGSPIIHPVYLRPVYPASLKSSSKLVDTYAGLAILGSRSRGLRNIRSEP